MATGDYLGGFEISPRRGGSSVPGGNFELVKGVPAITSARHD